MRTVIVSVRDSAVAAFGRPAFVPSSAAAVRSFKDEVNRKDANNEMNKHPSDFILFELGFFDEQSGKFDMHPEPLQLLRGQDCIDAGFPA